MITAHDLATALRIPLRTAQRLLAKLEARGLATRVATRGRPALATTPAALATLGCALD